MPRSSAPTPSPLPCPPDQDGVWFLQPGATRRQPVRGLRPQAGLRVRQAYRQGHALLGGRRGLQGHPQHDAKGAICFTSCVLQGSFQGLTITNLLSMMVILITGLWVASLQELVLNQLACQAYSHSQITYLLSLPAVSVQQRRVAKVGRGSCFCGFAHSR